MKHTFTNYILAAIVAIAVLFVFSCGNNNDDAGDTGSGGDTAENQADNNGSTGDGQAAGGGDEAEAAPEADAAGDDDFAGWDIPFLNAVTGPIAGIADYLQWGAERAAEEINEAGGIAGRPVRVRAVDTGVDPEKGAVEMAALADESLVVLGPVPEPVILAAMPIAVEQEMPAFTASTGYEYAVRFFPWSISWFPPTSTLSPIVSEWVNQAGGMYSVVQFVENFGPWPDMATAHTRGAEAAGSELVLRVEVPSDAVTLDSVVVRGLSFEPDGIIISTAPERAGKIVAELMERGWSDPNKILIFSSADDAPLYTTAGDALNGTMIYNYINPNVDEPRWNAFREAFKEEYDGLEPFSLSANYYDAVYMIKESIEATGITGNPEMLDEEREMLMEYARNIDDFDGILYNWSMVDGVPADRPVYLFELQDGSKNLVAETVARYEPGE